MPPFQTPATGPRALALELTKGCNLRCGYCYYATRENAYDPRTAMTVETAERSVDMVLDQGPPEEPAHLHLFGGEPLLNVPLVKHVVEYGSRRARELDREITFELTTNGTRLSGDVVAFLNTHGVRVGVSFDGPPEVQDRARPASGGSSYAQALPGIRRLLTSRRGTPLAGATHASTVVTRHALDITGTVRHLEELGFERVILTPVTDLTGNGDGIREEDLPRALAAFDDLARDYEERVRAGRAVVATWYERLVARIRSGERRTAPCGGGRDYLGVAADGSVSLCYRFFEDGVGAMGNVIDGVDRTLTGRLETTGVDARTTCSTCWARWYCGGGCHHDNLVSSGDMAEPNPIACDIFRHSMDRALEVWARLSRDGVLDRAPPAVCDGPAGGGSTGMSERPRARAGCHVREVGPERVVYEPGSHELVVLNATAAFILEHCDGTRTQADLVDLMSARFAAPRDVIEADVAAALDLLRGRGLLE